MFDIGWSEMAIIMLLALIIIGPKDLPRVARTIGQWVRKGRMMAREFQTSLEDMARDTELEDVKKEIEKVGRTDFKKAVENTIDPKGDLAKAFDTSADGSDKPALTDKSGNGAEKTPVSTAANGHASGTTAKAETSTTGKASSGKTSTSEKSTGSKAATGTPASKAKTVAKTTKTTARTTKTTSKARTTKPAAAKKPVSSKSVSSAKRSAKPATASAKRSGAKSSSAKRSADPAPVDEGGGTDQAAVAAKSS